MKPGELVNEYRRFWMAFQTVCKSAGVIAKPSDGGTLQLRPDRAKPGELCIASRIYLQNWPLRGAGPAEKIHILINGLETYIQSTKLMRKSSIQVLYTEVTGAGAKTLMALHYDFDHVVQAAHPVFHAQFGMGDFTHPSFKEMGFRSAVPPAPTGVIFNSVRIPTAGMSLASVLMSIAADHLDAKFLNQIITVCESSQLVKWNAKCDALQARLATGTMLPSYQWYTKL